MKKQTLLLSMLCASNIMVGGNVTREVLEKKSLPELQTLFEEKDSELELTPEGLIVSYELRDWEYKREKFLRLLVSCGLSQGVTGYFMGSSEDCEKLPEAEEQLIAQGAKLVDARKAEKEANKQHMLI